MKAHKGQTSIKPIKIETGAWAEMEFDAKLTRCGLVWYRVKGGMGGRGDREDWVADIPGICISVHDYNFDRKKFWTAYLFHGSFDKAIRKEMALSLQHALIKCDEMEAKITNLKKSAAILSNLLRP